MGVDFAGLTRAGACGSAALATDDLSAAIVPLIRPLPVAAPDRSVEHSHNDSVPLDDSKEEERDGLLLHLDTIAHSDEAEHEHSGADPRPATPSAPSRGVSAPYSSVKLSDTAESEVKDGERDVSTPSKTTKPAGTRLIEEEVRAEGAVRLQVG